MSNIDPPPNPTDPEPLGDTPPDAPRLNPDVPSEGIRSEEGSITSRPPEPFKVMPPDYGPEEPFPPPPPRKPHPNIWWALLWLFGFIVVTQFVGGFLGAILGGVYLVLVAGMESLNELGKVAADQTEFTKSWQFALIMGPAFLFVEVLSIVFGYVAVRLIAGRAWPRKVALRLPSLTHFVLTVLLLPGFYLVAQAVSLATLYFFPGLPSLGNLGVINDVIGHWPLWLGVLIIGIGPGIGEELFCRAFLGRGLVGNYGVFAGVVLTSVLFGAMHVEPLQVIYASVLGVFLHTVYLTTRSLLMPMMLHTLNNSFSVLVAWAGVNGLMPDGMDWMKDMDDPNKIGIFAPVYVGAFVLSIVVCVGLYISRARLAAADDGPFLPWTPGYPGADHPPPNCGTVVVHPAMPGLAALALGLFGFLVFMGCCYVTYLRVLSQ